MNPIRTGQNREKWLVTNLTSKVLTISDLLCVPALDPGKPVDILFYETKDKISGSNILPLLVKKNWVSLKKIGVVETVIVSAGTVDPSLQTADQQMALSASASSGTGLVVMQNADYTVQETDSVILVNASNGTVNISLFSASGLNGKQVSIKKVDSTSNVVNVIPFGSETIDGLGGISMNTKGTSVDIVSDGMNWYII